jgi:menaquinone-dependent protoporphyrinogen oxidase
MTPKILVAYATKCGSTIEIAESIGKTLASDGAAVEVKPVQEIGDISGYDAVVLGSAIRMGQWLPEALEFAKQHQATLEAIPTAIFTAHILNTDDSPASLSARQSYTAQLRQIIDPCAEAFFAGKIDPALLNFFEMTLFKLVDSPEGDFRDWKKIEAWTETVYGRVN